MLVIIIKISIMNFILLDDHHILLKMGIIINLETFNIIYSKSKKNQIRLNNGMFDMSYLMCYYFEYKPDININNIYHIDDNIYNNSLDNLLYINNNVLHQNLFLCNNVFLYMIIIEKYNYKFELIQRITNLEKKYKSV